MPVYLHVYNLIILKQAVIDKYSGGLEQFKADFNFPHDEHLDQEDDELLSFGLMDDDFDIERLRRNGLHYDETHKSSNDMTYVYRYDPDPETDVPWLYHNQVFAWHKDADESTIEEAMRVSNMPMNEIGELQDIGKNPLTAIRAKP